jgi:tetratricopeptide (TPR) repeat protein/mono/diheme cytochrome c family protein
MNSVRAIAVYLPAVALMAAAAATMAVRVPAPSHDTSSGQQITFNRDIAPVMFHSCVACHHPGGAGPFSLLTYQDAREHARQIATVTRTRFMPPWLPEPEHLKFADELFLSDQEIEAIQEWVTQGSVEGSLSDLPARPEFTEGWELGKPDLILTARKPFVLTASGTDQYWNFILPVPINQTRWLKSIEIRPGQKRLVHHANVLVDRTQASRAREKSPGSGFGGMEIRLESETFDPDSHFLFWKPGTIPYIEPDGMALRLDKGTDLVLNMHLQPSGKAEVILPSVGLYFTDRPATMYPMLLQIENDAALDIPPGEKNFVVTDSLTLPVDVDLLAIYPHAHYLGKDMLALATQPDGTSATLLHIKQWDLNWQAVYRYANPVFLPKGTVISMKYSYDNSEANRANPNQPPRRVTAGNRARDEMAHLWLQVLPHETPSRQSQDAAGDPRMLLQEALARHNIEKDPSDFDAHYNLAAMLQARGELEEAVKEYEYALRVRPHDAIVDNALGGAFLAAGRVDEAIPRLVKAVKDRPDYFDAHYNLGNALASKGDFSAAAVQFRTATRLRPDDADAEANLGSALVKTGNISEAKSHYQRALRLNPSHALAHENLQELDHRQVSR